MPASGPSASPPASCSPIFFGLDVVPFAVELAKVTLMLAKELELREAGKFAAADGLHLPERPLPLDNLDQQILCADSLFTDWPKADAIIGNPPYLGSRYLAKEHGYDYANKLYARFPGVPKMADFCTHWFRLAHDALPPGGRAGLVGTNMIRKNESREASLDYIVANGGTITEAVSTQKWSGEAQVSVSIVNWVKGEESGEKVLITQIGDAADSGEDRELLSSIPPSLKSETDVSAALDLLANTKPKMCFTGQNPQNVGFMLSPDEAAELIRADPRNREVLHPYMVGDDLVGAHGPTRWVIDFGQCDIFGAKAYPLAYDIVRTRVMPDVLARAEQEKAATGKERTRWTRMAERWWQFREPMPGTMAAIRSVRRYIACARVSKRPIFEFVHPSIHPDGKLVIFAFDDDYSFGVIQSGFHWAWTKARGGTLETRITYTADTVFATFPWPQTPTKGQIAEVAAAAVALRALRREKMAQPPGYSLRTLYRTLEEPAANPLREAHTRLDTAVRAAYAMPKAADPLAFLLALNLTLAAREEAGETIIPPGLALPERDRPAFITTDYIEISRSIP